MLLVRLIVDLYFHHGISINELRDNTGMTFRIIDMDNESNYVSLEHPTEIGVEYKLDNYNQWYVEFISRNYESLKNIGLERANIFINVFFSGQCNFEIFDNASLAELSKYAVSLPISVFNLPKEELRIILKDNGYSEDIITQIFTT